MMDDARLTLAVGAMLVVAAVTIGAAATTNTETVAEHTTDSDFEDAQLTNMSIVGTGTSASVEAASEINNISLSDTAVSSASRSFTLGDYSTVTQSPTLTLTGVTNTESETKSWMPSSDTTLDPDAAGTSLSGPASGEPRLTIETLGTGSITDLGYDGYQYGVGARGGDTDLDGEPEIYYASDNGPLAIYDPDDDTETVTSGSGVSDVWAATDAFDDGAAEAIYTRSSDDNIQAYNPSSEYESDLGITSKYGPVVTGDTNGDGTPEGVYVDGNDNVIEITDLEFGYTDDTGYDGSDVAVGDSDGDGTAEVLIDTTIHDLAAGTSTSTTLSAGTKSFAADTDGDGDPEFIADSGSDIEIYDPGSGSISNTGGSDTYGLTAGDVTGDGRADVLFIDTSYNVKIYNPATDSVTDTGGQSWGPPSGIDVDRDGLQEVVFGTKSSGSLSYYDPELPASGSVDVGDDGSTDATFDLGGGESKSISMPSLDPGDQIGLTTDASVNVTIELTEETTTQSPSGDLNGNSQAASGTLASGQSTTLSYADSALARSATNTLDVAVADSSLSDDAPPMTVDYDFSTTTTSTWTESEYISPNVTASNITGATVDIAMHNASGTVTVERFDGSSWSTAVSKDVTTNGTVYLDPGTINGTATVRVRATFSRDGDMPYAEVSSSTVQAENHAPTIDAASRTTRYEDITVNATISDTEFDQPQGEVANATIYWEGSAVKTIDNITSESEISYSRNGVADGSYDWSVRAEDDAGLTTWSTQTLTVDHFKPTIVDAEPVGETTQYPKTLNVTIEDADFVNDGDQVDVFFSLNGDDVGSDTLTENGTASAPVEGIPAGSNSWSVSVQDQYGESQSRSYSFTAPEELEIRNESAPSELVTNATVKLQFYYPESGGDVAEIYSRNTTDGTINMTNLPADRPFTIVADTDEYYPRRIFVPSLFDAQEVFLLPDNETAVDVIFEVEDYTGRFPQEVSVLEVQRSLNDSWKTVVGDYFGSSGEFPAQIAYNERHRLVMRNTDTGETTILGSYTPLSAERQTVEVSPRGVEGVKGAGVVSKISPSSPRVPARGEVSFQSSVSTGDDITVSEWSMTIYYDETNGGNSTLTSVESLSDGGDLSKTVDLSERPAGEVVVVVAYETSEGATGKDVKRYSVSDTAASDFSLLSVLDSLMTQVAPENQGIFQATTALILSVVFTGAVASKIRRVSTEMIGLIHAGFITAFAILGWVSYSLLFIVAVGWGSLTFLGRRY